MLDIRSGSSTFGRWHAEELTGDNHRCCTSGGFAHGYLTLTDDTEVSYLVGHRYAPESRSWNSLGRSGVRHSVAIHADADFIGRSVPCPLEMTAAGCC